MTKANTKNIHFLVPRPLYEEFKIAFPEKGLMTNLFTKFMQLAIEGAKNRDAFVRGIYEDAVEEAKEEEVWND
jgi:hypothetical protein